MTAWGRTTATTSPIAARTHRSGDWETTGRFSKSPNVVALIQAGIDASRIVDMLPVGHYNHGPLQALLFAAHMLNDPSFDALVRQDAQWPQDRPAIDQLQRRYYYMSQDFIDNGGTAGKHSAALYTQDELLGFPGWSKIDKAVPKPGDGQTSFRCQAIRSLSDHQPRLGRSGLFVLRARGRSIASLRSGHQPEHLGSVHRSASRTGLPSASAWLDEQKELGNLDTTDYDKQHYPSSLRPCTRTSSWTPSGSFRRRRGGGMGMLHRSQSSQNPRLQLQ